MIGLTDLSGQLGVSHQDVRKLMTANATNFLLPIHCGSVALWHLMPVLRFLHGGRYAVDPKVINMATAAMRVNTEKEPAWLAGAPWDDRLTAAA